MCNLQFMVEVFVAVPTEFVSIVMIPFSFIPSKHSIGVLGAVGHMPSSTEVFIEFVLHDDTDLSAPHIA